MSISQSWMQYLSVRSDPLQSLSLILKSRSKLYRGKIFRCPRVAKPMSLVVLVMLEKDLQKLMLRLKLKTPMTNTQYTLGVYQRMEVLLETSLKVL